MSSEGFKEALCLNLAMECEGHLELCKRSRMKYILVTEGQKCVVGNVSQASQASQAQGRGSAIAVDR